MLKACSLVYNYPKISNIYWVSLIFNDLQLHVYNLKIKEKMNVLDKLSIDYIKKKNK